MPTIPEPIGWPLLPTPGDDGQLVYPTLDRSVRDQLRIILSTRPGEQLMRPDFAAGLQSFLTEPNTLETRRAVHDTIKAAIGRWEPRVLLDRVDVLEVPAEPTHLRVEIHYRLRRTGSSGRFGLTLALGS